MEKLEKRIFVMGDIHGTYEALLQCLKRSSFNYETDTLIQLGDVVDRNPDVFECVEELLKIKNLIAIKGNHDVWFQHFLETDYHPQSWNHGGIATLKSYLKHCQPNGKIIKTAKGYKSSLNAGDIPENHKTFFKRQKFYYLDDENKCFIHAGFDTEQNFFSQPNSNYYSDRILWENIFNRKINFKKFNYHTQFKEIFLGHTSTLSYGQDKPISVENITNLDTGCGKGGRLTIMDLHTKKFWQSY